MTYTYHIYTLDGQYAITVTVNKPGEQAVCNELIDLGYNPLLYTWDNGKRLSRPYPPPPACQSTSLEGVNSGMDDRYNHSRGEIK